jgi:hypothetical protein
MKFKLNSEPQARALMVRIWPKVLEALNSGKELTIEIIDAVRSNDQNKLYHVIIAEIAKQAKHLGAQWDEESWKRFLIDQFASETGLVGGKVVPSLDSQRIVQLGIQSRKFTQQQASQFVEWLYCWCATNGIELDDTKSQT